MSLADRCYADLESVTVRIVSQRLLVVHRGLEDGSSLNDDEFILLPLEGMFHERSPDHKIVPL